jgi:general secretion pathway protein A
MNRPSEVLGSPAPGNGLMPGYKSMTGNGGNFLPFFGLRRNPFNVSPDPRNLFWTPQTLRALSELTNAVETRKSLVVLTGEVGTGKTTLINHLLNSLREREAPVAFVFNSHLDIENLYDFILADFGIKEDPARGPNVRKILHNWLFSRRRAGQHPILIVDEAQGLTFEVLEEIRMLLNLEVEGEKLIQIVLSGQPELDVTLAKPQLLQLRQRISLRCKTAPLTIAETHDYIHRRLEFGGAQPERVFAPEALDAVYFYSGGTPRVVNLLCEQALMHAHNSGLVPVPSQIVEEVAREFEFDDFKPFPRSLSFDRPAAIAEILPMPASPTKMRMAAMAARQLSPSEAPQVAAPVAAPSPAPKPAPRIAPAPAPPLRAVSAPPVAAPVPAPTSTSVKGISAVPAKPAPVVLHRDHKPAAVKPRVPLATQIGISLGSSWRVLQRTFAISSRWLRQPMRPGQPRRTDIS